MGKGSNDLWDDSALVDAFDQAMSKYKAMHGASYKAKASKKEDSDDNIVTEAGPIAGTHCITQYEDSANFVQDIITDTGASCSNDSASNRDVETQENEFGFESCPLEQSPSGPSINEKTEGYVTYADPQNEEYNQLLTSYYEIEGQRQKILQQLQQTSNVNYQWPSQGSTIEVNNGADYNNFYPGMPPMSCSSHGHSSCLGSAYTFSPSFPGCYGLCTLGNTISPASHAHNKPAGKEKEIGEVVDGQGHPLLPESSKETDLSVVLGAWYSAGFYTGRYLLEQSLKKG